MYYVLKIELKLPNGTFVTIDPEKILRVRIDQDYAEDYMEYVTAVVELSEGEAKLLHAVSQNISATLYLYNKSENNTK